MLRPEQVELYLTAGYTVVSIDYRLAPETKLQAIFEDVRDAYDWVISQGPELFNVDPDRLAVIGHSAGGYLTLMAGFLFHPRPKALVSFYGYGDILGDWYSRPDPYYNLEPALAPETACKGVGGPRGYGKPSGPALAVLPVLPAAGVMAARSHGSQSTHSPMGVQEALPRAKRNPGVSTHLAAAWRQGHRCSIRAIGANG